MKKWSKPQLNQLDLEKTHATVCPGYKPNAKAKELFIFNPDDVTNNCKNCVEVGAQDGTCKYIGHENAFCS